MKYKKGLNWFLLLIALFMTYLWRSGQQTPSTIEYRDILKNLDIQKDSIQQLNAALSKQSEKLQVQSDSILLLLQKDHVVIQQLNQKKNEKIRAIDQYDRDELYQFFSNYQLRTQNPPSQK